MEDNMEEVQNESAQKHKVRPSSCLNVFGFPVVMPPLMLQATLQFCLAALRASWPVSFCCLAAQAWCWYSLTAQHTEPIRVAARHLVAHWSGFGLSHWAQSLALACSWDSCPRSVVWSWWVSLRVTWAQPVQSRPPTVGMAPLLEVSKVWGTLENSGGGVPKTPDPPNLATTPTPLIRPMHTSIDSFQSYETECLVFWRNVYTSFKIHASCVLLAQTKDLQHAICVEEDHQKRAMLVAAFVALMEAEQRVAKAEAESERRVAKAEAESERRVAEAEAEQRVVEAERRADEAIMGLLRMRLFSLQGLLNMRGAIGERVFLWWHCSHLMVSCTHIVRGQVEELGKQGKEVKDMNKLNKATGMKDRRFGLGPVPASHLPSIRFIIRNEWLFHAH
eukprot:1137612-Pelagomonas_calceolata.AAC.5